ncbi:MAG: N-6 DNA methylase [Candidatus Azambacteria bacterium]|nr:N-6 DNA methylase [Candidatus Azambacteria bacterium]
MSTKPQELNKVIADLRQIIVGKVAMPTDQIEQITLFLFLKQLSRKHDDLVRIGSKELIFTGAWERYHFDVLMRHSGEDLVKECREAVESLYKNPHIDATVRKVFERSYLKILEPKVLSSFLQYLNDKFSDGLDLGDFYESLLPILGTQNELGQFRTPRHIIDFIVRVVDPNIGEKIADPACGTAGFLVAAFNYLKGKYTDEKGRLKLNPEQTKKLYNETIFGWDMEPLMVKFSLANLYLHGLKVPNVSENDTLLNENLWQHTFDIIVANPPFITPKGGARRHSRFAITSNKTEVLFCEYMVHHLNFNGRMGVIVPEGIIFDGSKGHQAIRKLFLDNGLWCVVTLPAQVFQPYSGVKTSIIFLDKTLEPENILFYKIENHGFSLNTTPAPVDKNDLPEATKFIKEYKEILQDNKQKAFENSKYYTVAKTKILDNKFFSLNSEIYTETVKKGNQKWPTVDLVDLINTITPPKKIQKNKFGSIGKYPIIDQSQEEISGWTDDESTLVKPIKPVVIFGDHTRAVKYSERPFAQGADGIKILAIDNKLLPKFLYFILKTIPIKSDGYKRHFSKLKRQKIPLPPLEIQEQIVSELESYQRVIDGARAVAENWKPSFEIDPKWEIVKLGDVSERVTKGTTPTTAGFKFQDSGINFVKIESIDDNGYFIADKFAHIDQKCNEALKRSQLKGGDVLFSIAGALGRVALVNKDILPANTNQALAIVTPKENLNSKYLEEVLRSPLIFNKIDGLKVGVAQYNISLTQVSDFEIPLPSLEIQKQIVAKIEDERKIVEANRKLIDLFQQKIEARIKSIYG